MTTLIIGVLIGIVLAMVWSRLPPVMSFRPSMEWTPEANCDDPFKLAAYKEAANNLGVRIKIGPPVPCAGYSMCGGMDGIWLHRDDIKKLKPYQFTDEMWKAHSRLTG